MSDPAIIEAAARALRDANIYDAPVWKTYHQMADAMLTAVTPRIEADAWEEAAKVAENHPWGGYQIAAAIRALITKDSGDGN